MDHYQRSLQNTFSAHPLNRAAERRLDKEWLDAQLSSPQTRIIPVWRLQNLFLDEQTPLFLESKNAKSLLDLAESNTFLGKDAGKNYFAIGLPTKDSSIPERFSALGKFLELKMFGAFLGPREGALYAYARAMVYWHQRHRFCGDCGSPTASVIGGHQRDCTNDQCKQLHFPRTDPSVIVLVTHEDKCLLGRQPMWPKKMYSTIAGFVEPGESIENAVVREVQEETGVLVGEIHYQSSQPWPFPSSLMLGFHATAIDPAIHLKDDELEDARWFSREEVMEGKQNKTLKLPSIISISRYLINDWLNITAT
ncbi:MAG: NAD(+) diphosphatase [SAR324 cluster bacterium]|nr:NAD(+) diphosphatase [SAR324 cluster bacterium]